MLFKIIQYSVRHKALIILSVLTIAALGIYAFFHIPIGAVPDITNNQVQVITVSPQLATQDVEQFITRPIEMELSHLPGVKEIRSISKFGISYVTVVFDEKMGTYLPRQLIAEKLPYIAEKIPGEFGRPEMGPITTGLGEIYQYYIDVEPEYRSKYSLYDLRIIQDWIIRRHLAGINGVVEINSWGGYLKQYEIVVYPERLYQFHLGLLDVYDAVINNNSIAGGAYIEKNDRSFFIRGEGLIKTTEDILNIVVATRDHIPILIRDIGEVRIGHATRYGAITANGEGEKVLGQIMMLKGAAANLVMKEVKERLASLQEILPPGVKIVPINDRSELIAKTTTTVFENLLLGSIAVFLMVLLFLGNLRASLIISSVIPLTLLITILLMYLTGIDINLMSLGALDFGVIIDGAVIIVEFILLQFLKKINQFDAQNPEFQHNKEKIVIDSTYQMISSAIHGQIIILIVFLPIYVLQGVEGKMFQPMALAFSFALIGAIILSLTWVPVMCAVFLEPQEKEHAFTHRVSRKFLQILYRVYEPLMQFSYRMKYLVLSGVLVVFILAIYIFTTLGGEFVPTLDEGDFVIQPVIRSGTSLSKTIELTTQMEQLLLRHFPDEIERIASRIGAAEVPTDPMGMEEVDMIVKLKPRSKWTKASTKEELAELFKRTLETIPGIEYEFTQPIEMRFNELITGVRSDLAIKIFGDELNTLNDLAVKIKKLIEHVPGAADISIEKTVGLPQILIKYKREKIAHYGLNIEQINKALSTAFGGQYAGLFFEGEKSFQMVVKMMVDEKVDLQTIANLPVYASQDKVYPLSEFADISYFDGPAKISREQARRRIVINVNVRNRDLQSVAQEIQTLIKKHITLPEGYMITYGGQFQNLQEAVRRLTIAIPVAMLLIFIFIHFALKSFLKALMVYVSVPMAIIGGIFLLKIRAMPFSISAGIGFIALFGIAVMNGLVLIEHLEELKKQGMNDLKQRIFEALKDRFRPVLLTASSAAMGFLPMAISHSAGAEVQRPLATVVIGGVMSSSILTLIVLPLLYSIFENMKPLRLNLNFKKSMLSMFLIVTAFHPGAQTPISLDRAKQMAETHFPYLQSMHALHKAKEQKARFPSWLEPINFVGTYDETNVSPNQHPHFLFGVSRNFYFPSYYISLSRTNKSDSQKSLYEYENAKNQVFYYLSVTYVNYILEHEKTQFLRRLDSLFQHIQSNIPYYVRIGSISDADRIMFQLKFVNFQQQLIRQNTLLTELLLQFQWYIGDSTCIPELSLPEIELQIQNISSTPYVLALQEEKKLVTYQTQTQKRAILPQLYLQYQMATNQYKPAYHFNVYEAGITLPLWSALNEHRTLTYQYEAQIQDIDHKLSKVRTQQRLLKEKFTQMHEQAQLYKSQTRADVNLLLYGLQKAFHSGQISMLELLQALELASNEFFSSLDFLQEYYKTYFQIKYAVYVEE